MLWSAGCVDWYFTDNNIDLEISNAAMRYGLAEEGGIVCMHDRSEAPNSGERLKLFLDSIWNYWDFVDFNTCIGRSDVNDIPYSTASPENSDSTYTCYCKWSVVMTIIVVYIFY